MARCALVVVMVCLGTVACSRGGSSDADAEASADGSPADTTVAATKETKAKDAKKKKTDQAVPVEVAALTRGSIESVIRASASLEADRQVAVVAEAARRVTELLVEEGDNVTKGTLLCRLQDSEQKTTLKRTEFTLSQAQREFDRQKSLFEQDLTSEQTFKDASDELERQKLLFEDAAREMSYTEVRAPISGTVTTRHVNLGNHVQVGQQLFDIVDFQSLEARVFVPEKNLAELKQGQSVRVTARAVRDEPFLCKVKRVAPVVDARTGTVKVTVAVGKQAGLRPGLFVDVSLVTQVHDNALLIPKRALIYDNDQIFVYRLADERKVERLLVVPVLADQLHVMPADGFSEGDEIVVAGQAGLKDGAKVKLPGDADEPESNDEASNKDGKLAQEAATR